jgi:PD-(D/E)XK endonuclease
VIWPNFKVAADLRARGYRIAIPYGEDCVFDLILCRDDEKLERVQVKYVRSNGPVIEVRCRSHSLTNGKVRSTKHYTAAMIDWLAIWDAALDRCFYIPAAELGAGMWVLSLRLGPTRNNQRRGIRLAERYTTI